MFICWFCLDAGERCGKLPLHNKVKDVSNYQIILWWKVVKDILSLPPEIKPWPHPGFNQSNLAEKQLEGKALDLIHKFKIFILRKYRYLSNSEPPWTAAREETSNLQLTAIDFRLKMTTPTFLNHSTSPTITWLGMLYGELWYGETNIASCGRLYHW